ncbi:MAG: efflux RND transporter permease subunit [Burkholderiales bacterium]|nr:efflux RND transporter permease subunit [Burkholderiales bacterium]
MAAAFQQSRLTPLLALVALLLGLFAVLVTPREEEPQINVTMANVLVSWPGAGVADVEARVAIPVERWLLGMDGVEHVMALSRPGLAVLTVQFKVGVPRQAALVRLQEALDRHAGQLPGGAGQPLLAPKGIADVPIVSFTLTGAEPSQLAAVARSLEAELQRIAGVREVQLIGAPQRVLQVRLNPARLAALGLDVLRLQQALAAAQGSVLLADRVQGDRAVQLQAGPWIGSAAELAELVVGVRGGKPIHLREVAELHDGPAPLTQSVWHVAKDGTPLPALTLAVTKKDGENAIDVARRLQAKVSQLQGSLIPDGVQLLTTRDYGDTANTKAQQLMTKLLFATASVVALVFALLGRREALIVGIAVGLTLTATLFASWAWGFTLNRVSLFALIFSIGILVDDAIVVVENIHRHQMLHPGKSLAELIPGAVAEVGGPTILATLTVIAALLPMAFVSGLMGPYMGPIPINASMGMVLSLLIAFAITPWLALKLMPAQASAHSHGGGFASRIEPLFERIFRPLLATARARRWLGLGVAGLIAVSLALPALGLVVLKMLPFDNKSEFQVVLDLPAGTPMERTQAALAEIADHLVREPEVLHVQAYAGTAAPINFNGLVRQYFLRADPHQGDLQVNLVGKGERKAQSHAIATRLRPLVQKIAARHGANAKVVEVPPGPPVLAPLVAEIYGPDEATRQATAARVRRVFEQQNGVVDVDDSGIALDAPRQLITVDQRKAMLAGVSVQDVLAALQAGQSGLPAAELMDGRARQSVPVMLRLAGSEQGDLNTLLQLRIGPKQTPLSELVQVQNAVREQPRWRKDGLGVHFVVADAAGKNDSPLYALFGMRSQLQDLPQTFISQPDDSSRGPVLKWDGEWQITYETFRDMGLAYAVGLLLIYLLVVAEFGSYVTPLIIMAPIPLTIVGVMPGHALLGAPFTATSMIGMIALAGIIVRNSILLVDFIELQRREGLRFEDAIVRSAITRAQPIVLTGLAAMAGAVFILDDPIFNGLAISLLFGIAVSTVLTLVVIPILYFAVFRNRSSS